MRGSMWMKGIALLLLPIFACGCSTVFGRQNDDQNVSFNSNVQGVQVNCSGKRIDTPGSLPLKQSKNHACVAEAAGYEKKVFNIDSGMSWSGFGHSTATNTAIWGWWTLGIGTGIGWLIDAVSGSMRNLKKENIYLDMKPDGTTSKTQKVLEKTAEIGTAVLTVPIDVVQNTASTVLDTTLRGGAEQLGIVEDKKEEASDKASDDEKQKKVTIV